MQETLTQNIAHKIISTLYVCTCIFNAEYLQCAKEHSNSLMQPIGGGKHELAVSQDRTQVIPVGNKK